VAKGAAKDKGEGTQAVAVAVACILAACTHLCSAGKQQGWLRLHCWERTKARARLQVLQDSQKMHKPART